MAWTSWTNPYTAGIKIKRGSVGRKGGTHNGGVPERKFRGVGYMQRCLNAHMASTRNGLEFMRRCNGWRGGLAGETHRTVAKLEALADRLAAVEVVE